MGRERFIVEIRPISFNKFRSLHNSFSLYSYIRAIRSELKLSRLFEQER